MINEFPHLTISQVSPDGPPRPFWSVMIPAYNPPADYLAQTLRSVLVQDPGPEQMQIEVVDDCSPKVDVAALVRETVGDRVKVSQTPKNLGLAGCWNTCIERARGQWVHILHQDDLVLPGFYERLGVVIKEAPEAGMVFCRFAYMDEDGHWQGLGSLKKKHAGLLDNWLERVVTGQHLECPAVVVKRSVYAHLGGFSNELNFALDLEMWIRIGAHYPVGYEPAILACYRRHAGNETARLEQGGGTIMDVARALQLCRAYLPPEHADRLVVRGQTFWAGTAFMLAEKAYVAGSLDACMSQLAAVRVLCDQGEWRRRRLKLAARVGFKRVLGPKLVTAIRQLRSPK